MKMTPNLLRSLQPPPATQKSSRPSGFRHFLSTGPYNLFVWVLLLIYLLPVAFMVVTAFKSDAQLEDPSAPWYPTVPVTFSYQGTSYPLFDVPMESGTRRLALVSGGHQMEAMAAGVFEPAEFLDPQDPQAGTFVWDGDPGTMRGIYRFGLAWDNFKWVFSTFPFPQMMGDTLFLVLISEIGVLISSILVGYGFSRFPLPGGDLLFYVLIATILIPEKVTLIPTFYIYVQIFHWYGKIYPLVVHLFFGNAVFIFLLRQNFRSLPLDLEEAAMLDGAGTLRRLFSVVLPQSWPVMVTITLLQLFYTWNETRLVTLYMSTNTNFAPISFAVQRYVSSRPIENTIEAANMVLLIIPVIVLMLSQRFFMRSMIITGMEKK
jgi:multiple sugar transport system permease protein